MSYTDYLLLYFHFQERKRNFLPSFYTDDLQVISAASSLLIIATFFQVSDGLQATALGVLRGIQDVKIPTVISFVSYFIIDLEVIF